MVPVINDISTDLEDVPQFLSNPKLNPLPQGFIPQIKQGYPDLKTLVLPGSSKESVFAACRSAAGSMKRWAIVMDDPEAGVIEGVSTTLILRFKDDFTIRVRENAGSALVDMRSKSRVGKGDLGANAARISEYFEIVKKAFSTPAL